MRVEGTYTFPGAIERVFAALTNPDALARAIPGCERFIQFGPATADEETAYETRLRLGQRRQPYTVALRMKAARRPAYVTLDIRGHGTTGPITGSGSLDLVEQDSHTVVAYRFTITGPELPEVGDTLAQPASFIARATCAHLADEIYAEAEDEQVWARSSAHTSAAASANHVNAASGADGVDGDDGTDGAGEIVTARGRIITMRGVPSRALLAQPLPWTERALWMSAGLAMGLSAIALTAAIVRRIGAREGQPR